MMHATFSGGPLDGLQLPIKDPTLQVAVRRTRPWHLYRCVHTPVDVAQRMMSICVSEKYIEGLVAAQTLSESDIVYGFVRDLTATETTRIHHALRVKQGLSSERETQDR